MKEQITIDLPKRIGRLIEKGLVTSILVKTVRRDITINIKEDGEFVDDHDGKLDNTILITVNQKADLKGL